MSHLWAQAITQVEPPLTGTHSMWLALSDYLISPTVWVIERRNAPQSCEVFTLELDQPSSGVSVGVRAERTFVVALYHGKAVGFAEPVAGSVQFGALTVDRTLVYALSASLVQFCVSAPPPWTQGTVIKRLQLPLRELMPALGGPAAEYVEARSRLLPGESLDEARFHEVADTLRALLHGPGRRLIDKLLSFQ